MLKYEQLKTRVYVNLEPGLYKFYSTSATGKSRLCGLLKELSWDGCNCCGYTYRDFLEHKPIPKNVDVLLVDRYDLYNGQLAQDIIDASKSGVVLVDCKSIPRIRASLDLCRVSLPQYNLILVK